jgi:hypothetical protein
MTAMPGVRGRRTVSAAAAIALVATLVLPLVPVAAAAPAASPPGPCADVMPLASVAEGQVGTGWTVVRGTVPQPFRVQILGVYPDGAAAGRDLILVEVSDLPGEAVIAAGGGIWSGMSGSPVIIDGRLVGAVSYSFSTGPSRIGGLTPAEDMVRLLGYPDAGTPGAPAVAARPVRTNLSAQVRRELARRTGRQVAAAGDFERLPLPLAVSGVPQRGRELLASRLERAGLRSIVTRGAAAPAPTGAFATPVPGGNFAALIAYGDVTVGGTGTTTWVCESRALAFGHPLSLAGPAAFGASDARSLAIVADPAGSPFKLAAFGAPFGILDQDRLAGIRAKLGGTPALIPIVARIRDSDLGAARTGRTDVTASDWVPYVAPQHVYADMLTATDREGPGTATIRFRIDGRRANGDAWRLVLADRLVSTSDVQLEAAVALDGLLYLLSDSGVERVRFSKVRVDATVQARIAAAAIDHVRVSRNRGPFVERERMQVAPGDALALRVALRLADGSIRVVPVTIDVPGDASGFGLLEIVGGADSGLECEDPAGCETNTFKGWLHLLATAPRNDDLLVGLSFDGTDGPVRSTSLRIRQPDVVSGSVGIELTVR